MKNKKRPRLSSGKNAGRKTMRKLEKVQMKVKKSSERGKKGKKQNGRQ